MAPMVAMRTNALLLPKPPVAMLEAHPTSLQPRTPPLQVPATVLPRVRSATPLIPQAQTAPMLRLVPEALQPLAPALQALAVSLHALAPILHSPVMPGPIAIEPVPMRRRRRGEGIGLVGLR